MRRQPDPHQVIVARQHGEWWLAQVDPDDVSRAELLHDTDARTAGADIHVPDRWLTVHEWQYATPGATLPAPYDWGGGELDQLAGNRRYMPICWDLEAGHAAAMDFCEDELGYWTPDEPLATLDIVTHRLGPGHWCAQVVVRAGAAQALAAAAAAELEGGDELGAADLLCHTGWCGPYLPSPADVPAPGELLAGAEADEESEQAAVASAADAAGRIVELVRRHPELAVALVPGAGAALATVAAAARHTGVARELYKALPSPAKRLIRDGAQRASSSVARGLRKVFG